MKRILFCMLLILFQKAPGYSQISNQGKNSDSTNQADSLQDENSKNYYIQDNIKKIIKQVLDEENESNTGLFRLERTSKKVPLIKDYINVIDTITIINIDLAISDGFIQDISITAAADGGKDTLHFKNKVLISLLFFSQSLNDRIGIIGKTTNSKLKGCFIRLGDVIGYYPNVGKNFIPDDQIIHLDNSNTQVQLSKKISLNYLFDIRVYSDVLGTFFNQPNGIANTEGSLKIVTNTNNINDSRFVALNYLKPYFGVSKFDNSFGVTATDTLLNRIGRQNLLQRSWLNYGLSLNLFKYWFTGASRYDALGVNIGHNGYLSRVVNRPSDTSNVLINNWYAELFFEFKVNDFFGIDICSRLLSSNIPNIQNVNNNKSRLLFNPKVELYYKQPKKQSRLYLRFNSFIDDKERDNGFFQLQLGYSKNLNEIIED